MLANAWSIAAATLSFGECGFVASGVWRNGSAPDSRSKGWKLESLCPPFLEARWRTMLINTLRCNAMASSIPLRASFPSLLSGADLLPWLPSFFLRTEFCFRCAWANRLLAGIEHASLSANGKLGVHSSRGSLVVHERRAIKADSSVRAAAAYNSSNGRQSDPHR